jgi:hypothetical protein
MMKRTIVALAGLVLALAAQPASAQVTGPPQTPGRPYTPPAFSPYLNLYRSNNPGIDYFGLVRPQLEFNNFIQQQGLLNSQFLNQTGAQQASSGFVTGHTTRFLSYNQYFMSVGSGGGGSIAGPQTAPPPPVTAGLLRPGLR